MIHPGSVTGPHLISQAVPDGLADAFGRLWTVLAAAGDPIGFRPQDDPAQIRAAAVDVVTLVQAGSEELTALWHDTDLVGVVFLERGTGPAVRHRAEVKRLMVHPALRGHGWGSRLLDAAVGQARAGGIEQLFLFARGGHGLEEFYGARGWIERGRWPSSVRVAPGDDRDDIWFTLTL